MSAFSGKKTKGAMKVHRELKKTEAEERNAKTPPERRRSYRRAHGRSVLQSSPHKEVRFLETGEEFVRFDLHNVKGP